MAICCPSCRTPLVSFTPTDESVGASCQSCSQQLQLVLFPALGQNPLLPATATTGLTEGSSTCFYHANKPAVQTCESCGAFLCSLCDLDLGNLHLCPRCLESGKTAKTKEKIITHHPRYDGIAFLLSLTPFSLVLWFVTPVTAPLSLFLAIRGWKKPNSLISKGWAYRIFAILLALLQIVGFVAFVFLIISSINKHPLPHNPK